MFTLWNWMLKQSKNDPCMENLPQIKVQDWYSCYKCHKEKTDRKWSPSWLLFWSPSLKSWDKSLTVNHHLLFQRLKLKHRVPAAQQVTHPCKETVTRVKCLAFNLSAASKHERKVSVWNQIRAASTSYNDFSLSLLHCACFSSQNLLSLPLVFFFGMFLYFSKYALHIFLKNRYNDKTRESISFHYNQTE